MNKNEISRDEQLKKIMEMILNQQYKQALSDNIKRALRQKKLSTVKCFACKGK